MSDNAGHLLNRRNAVTTAAAIKLGIFTAVSILVTGVLVVIMGNVGFGERNEYQAIFTNATMLEKGDDVRVAGVNVGEVKKVEHYQRSMAKVTFKVDAGVEMTTASRAEIRFLNLVGDRYLALEEGSGADGAKALADGATIPVGNTKPALDLTVLFDGFKPLFAALTPDQVNELSMNLVQVLQGEGGTVKSLLAHTASLTTSLANRDQLIGEVIGNLSTTLKTVDDRHEQLSSLVVELKDWMTDLARDRDTIGSSLDNISQLTVTVADLLRRGRPLLKEDIAALRDLAKLLNRPENRKNLGQLLDRMPETMDDQTRTGTYGSWYQYYICGVSATIKLPIIGEQALLKQITKYIENFSFKSTAPRCQDH
ncbi:MULTISPECIES: MCE family protein [unclassified Nocardioides]|jgi:phospholipid/cholesterol/gamma-HCH transport system substrate-binding protein|uniref:MCE family protein n=1 Tax=unclassified Nocardioides TaxID=2615069 RepID=UPI0007032F6B|nr:MULTISPECIES: MCE family protein [unclassified Nocardioides]KRC58939.1 virulence factor Mce [Nocardioides sp. Root79]KRC76740.1 virulence factor Mce [Nocardioides sp. Root240]